MFLKMSEDDICRQRVIAYLFFLYTSMILVRTVRWFINLYTTYLSEIKNDTANLKKNIREN